uniref:C-type lectin domain-containing protein n=1 Tax=Labrus bergylta TaxID=56723 RepID=A0A3Q3EM08_9LABR
MISDLELFSWRKFCAIQQLILFRPGVSKSYWVRGRICPNETSSGSDTEIPFFCFNLMVDEVKKTWEEALEHCRETHTDLTSLNSETERLLALSEIQHNHITEWVWIGLRFLGDRWLWVNGDPLVYEAWPKGDQEHQCPLRKRCGALTKEGHWENWDCEEKLHFIYILYFKYFLPRKSRTL